MKNILLRFIRLTSLILLLFFISSTSVSASTLFLDNFNGIGELNSYSNMYYRIPGYSTSNVSTNHVETSSGDSFYLYSGLSEDNNCTSYNFKTDGWAAVLLRATSDFSQYDEIQAYFGNKWFYYHNGSQVSGNLNYNTTQTHNLKGCIYGSTFTAYLDGVLFTTQYNANNAGGYSGFGLYSPTSFMDDFKIETSGNTSNVNLNVPLLRQTSNPWQLQTYDSANLWNSSAKTIGYLGCALTSYTMILNFFGISKLPNGDILNPGTLNTWLKNNHGYIDGKTTGYVNPLAIASLSKKSKQINHITSFDSLEYFRSNGININKVSDDLLSSIPVVLEEPGHYVVARGLTSGIITINDPYYQNRNDLTYYNNSSVSMNELLPSNSNLSYILISGDNNISIKLKDSNNNDLGGDFLQAPLINDVTNQPAGRPIRIFLAQKPDTGKYYLDISSSLTGKYTVNILYYDIDGNVKEENRDVFIKNDSQKINIIFDSQNSNKSTSSKFVDFDSFISDISVSKDQKLINKTLADSLINLTRSTKEDFDSMKKLLVKGKLSAIETIIQSGRNTAIKPDAFQILLYDVRYLEKTL